MGACGLYDDHYEWPARVFLNKETAEKVCKDFNDQLRLRKIHYESPENITDYWDITVPFDPYFTCDYTGAGYSVTESIWNDVPPTQDDINETYEVD
jgi:hypothetical protein